MPTRCGPARPPVSRPDCGAGGLQPIKLRSGNAKLFFLAHVGGAPGSPDFRLKLLGSRERKGVPAEGGGSGGGGSGASSGSAAGSRSSGSKLDLLAAARGCVLEGASVVLPPG